MPTSPPPSPAPATAPSARPLLLSVLGDVVLPSGGTAWLGALTAAMESAGVAPQTTRQALRRLVNQDIVAPERHGRLAAYSLTAPGRRRLEEAAERIYLRRSLQWDGHWRVLTYTFAEEDRSSRDALRREIEWLGYGALGSGMWISPWDLGARLDAAMNKHGMAGSVETFVAELEGDDSALAERAYDLGDLRTAHQEFVREFDSERDGAADLDPEQAFALRIRLLHAWRKFLFNDPGLPDQMLPEDWLGDRAAEVFLTIYRAVEPAAWTHWDRIAAEADPDGAVPEHPRSNLETTRRAARTPQAATAGGADIAGGNGSAAQDDAGSKTATEQRQHERQPAASSATGNTGQNNGCGAAGDGDDERRTEEFLAHIHAGGKVESGDWMPDTYRQMNLKFIEMHANSEIMGALPEREWIARAPSLRRKRSLAAKVQDEIGHAHLIYRVAEDLGKPREQMFADLIAGRTKFHNVFHYPAPTWGDVACIGFLVDGAAIVTQRALLETSYAPYVRVMRRVVAEESLHYRHGEDIMLALASGTDEQFEMLQDAVNRWWEPTMHFFGTDLPAEDDALIHWGVKTRANEESRQEFLSQYVPKLWDMGVDVPDDDLRYDPTSKLWSYTEPDWDKLMEIVKGEPTEATATRLWWRRAMHDNHTWIRQIVTGDQPVAVAA